MPPRVLAGLVIAACLAVQSPALSYQLVWDDIDSLVQKNLGCEGLASCFAVPTSGTYYRPVFAASMAEGYAMADRDPLKAERVMHLQSLLLYAAMLVSLLLLFVACFGALNHRAVLATLIVGLHPIQTSAVAWVTGRADLLPTLFAALAVGAWVWSVRSAAIKWGWLGVGLAAWALAAFSKEQTLPLVLLLPLLFQKQVRALAVALPGAVVIAAVWASISSSLLERAPPIDPQWSTVDHLSVVTRTIAHSIKLLVLPLPTTLHRITAAPWGGFEANEVLVAVTGVALWLALGYRLRRQSALVFWLWSSLTVLPVLNVVPLNLALAPYRLILPLVGVAGLVGHALKPTVHWAVWVGTFVVLAGLTTLELPNWRSDATLATAIVEADPENVEWLLGAARELKDRRQLEPALEMTTAAVTTLFGDAQRVDEFISRAAKPELRRLMGEHSGLRRQVFTTFHAAGALCYRSTLLHELGRLEAEAADLDACTRISWAPDWREKYAEVLVTLGRRADAVSVLRELQTRQPSKARANRLEALEKAE